MITKINRFGFEWWVVQKRSVHLAIAVLVILMLAGSFGLYVWKFGNPLSTVGTATKTLDGARFNSLEGDVRVIRAATRATIVANRETELFPGDTVQTQASGRARINMADGSTLVVRPNSIITVRDNARANDGKKTNVHVRVESGQMFVRTDEQPEGTSNVVETPKTKNKVGQQTGVSFGVNPEGTEEIRVNTGGIETTNRSGEKTAVVGGEYVSVNPSGTVSKPQKLLSVPQPSEPRDLDKVFLSRNGSASITLKWLRPQSGTPTFYRVEVATSPFFVADGKVIERDQLLATEFNASDLRPGVYFWRVRAAVQTGQTSDWSEAQKFIVATRGTDSGDPVSNLAAELLGGNIYLVRGRAEPGTTIRIAGRETLVPTDKSFQVQITAPADASEIMVEAQDPQGNSSNYKVTLSGRRGRAD